MILYILRQEGKFLSKHKTQEEGVEALLIAQPYSIGAALSRGPYSLTRERVLSLDLTTQEFIDA